MNEELKEDTRDEDAMRLCLACITARTASVTGGGGGGQVWRQRQERQGTDEGGDEGPGRRIKRRRFVRLRGALREK